MEMTEDQQQLLEKIKQIEDPDILNLLADGAHTRALRCRKAKPETQDAAERFAAEVDILFSVANRLRRRNEKLDKKRKAIADKENAYAT